MMLGSTSITIQSTQTSFKLYITKYRKPGTGGVYQINDRLWEGKYSPRDAHGKRISRNVYAKTEEECEAKLAELIEQMKKEIAEAKKMLDGSDYTFEQNVNI